MKKDFLSYEKFNTSEIKDILAAAKVLKHMATWGDSPKPLDGKSVALIFRKPSLRTRVSFDVGVSELGGHPMYISDAEVGIGKRESVHDIAMVLSRYVSLIVIRTFAHSEVEQLAEHASVPVINALTDLLHPCQILGDALTIMEHKGSIDNVAITYLGDGNNVTNSWLDLSTKISLDLRIGCAKDCLPNPELIAKAQKAGVSRITITDNPIEAVKGTDVIYGDVWASMGEKDKTEEKAEKLKKFQINSELLKHSPEAIIMHCLPAERGKEITDEMMDGRNSVVFDQAENRLHIQKAIMLFLMKGLV